MNTSSCYRKENKGKSGLLFSPNFVRFQTRHSVSILGHFLAVVFWISKVTIILKINGKIENASIFRLSEKSAHTVIFQLLLVQ